MPAYPIVLHPFAGPRLSGYHPVHRWPLSKSPFARLLLRMSDLAGSIVALQHVSRRHGRACLCCPLPDFPWSLGLNTWCRHSDQQRDSGVWASQCRRDGPEIYSQKVDCLINKVLNGDFSVVTIYTRKYAQVVTNLQQTCRNAVPTTCQQDVFALLAPSLLTSCERLVDNLLQGCWAQKTCYKLFLLLSCNSTICQQVVSDNLVATW